jgi:hypothetical protein
MQAPPADLPAAHSMDTEWFAIDDRGHVGVFDSQEMGQVPEAHFTTWDQHSAWSDLLEEMLRLAAPGELRFVTDEVFVVPKLPYQEAVLVNDRVDLIDVFNLESPMLLELEAARDQRVLDERLGPTYMLGCEQPLAYVSRCEGLTVFEVWQELGIVRALLRPPMDPSRFGVFSYVNRDRDYYGGGPYERVASPMAAPLRVEALATGLRRRLGEVHLADVDFARDADVRPNASLPTRRWES